MTTTGRVQAAEAAERNDRPWFQVQAGILDSIDLNRLTPMQERVWWRLNALCCRRGVGDRIIGTIADIAWNCRLPERVVAAAVKALEAPGTDGTPMIEVGHNHVRIVKWEEYQPASTGAERKAEHRKKTRKQVYAARHAADMPRGMPRTCRGDAAALEAEAEAEAYVLPPGVREGPPTIAGAATHTPMPPVGIGRGTAKSDADLMGVFAEACAGLGQKLTWGHRYTLPAEQIFAWLHAHPDRKAGFVRKVAAFYAGQLDGVTPSLPRFATDFDRWAAASEAVAIVGRPARAKGRDDPRLGAPSAAKATHGWCKAHPGRAAVSAAGLCGECRDHAVHEASNA